MTMKKIALCLGILGALGFASLGFAGEAKMKDKGQGLLIIDITPENVNAAKITKFEGGDMEMKGLSVKRKKINPKKARMVLKKMKGKLKPGEEVIMGIGVVANGKEEACKLTLTMGKNHKFSDVKVDACEAFKSASLKQKQKRTVIILKKAS